MNRGNHRQDIFLIEKDRNAFTEALADSCEIYQANLVAYVLVINHLKTIGAEIENPFEDVLHQSILGTQEFVKWVKEKLPRKESREIPASRSLLRNLTVDQVVGAVSEFCCVDPAEIIDRNTRAKRVRQMAMELCYRYCKLKQRQIGQIFKVDYSTVSANRSRLKSRLKSDHGLKRQFEQIGEKIINLRDDWIGGNSNLSKSGTAGL